MSDFYTYWLVDTTGKTASKLAGPGKLNNPDGTLQQWVVDFYAERLIEFKNTAGTEELALIYYQNNIKHETTS